MAIRRGIRLRRPQLALIVLVLALAVGYGVNALRGGSSGPSTVVSTSSGPTAPAGTRAPNGTVALSSLPAEAAATVELIRSGGPFPYRQDGVVFANAERHLPIRPRGYYHEYTVRTPGSPDRGARRVITGQDGEFYYTSDHYESFVRVDVNR